VRGTHRTLKSQERVRRNASWRRYTVALIALAGFVLIGVTLDDAVGTGQIRDALTWIRSHHTAISPIGPLVFWLFGTLTIVANIPAVVVIACASVLYGSLGAAVMGMTCLLTASIVIYAVSQAVGRSLIAPHLNRFLPLLERHFQARGLRTVTLVRLTFFALPPTNWALAVMNIGLREYLIGTFLGSIPHVLMWAWIGAAALDMVTGQSAFSWRAPEVWGPLTVGGSVAILTVLIQRRAARLST